MGYIISLIILIFALFIWKIEKTFFNLGSLFCLIWAFICFLSALKLYNMYNFNQYAYIIILLGCFSFSLSYIFAKGKKIKFYINFKEKKSSLEMNIYILWILVLITFIYYTYFFILFINLIHSGVSYYMFRRMYQGYEDVTIYTSAMQQYFGSYIAVPVVLLLEPICIMWLLTKKYKKNRLLFSIICLTLVMYIITSASRIAVLTIAVQSVFALALYGYKLSRKLKSRIKKSILILICLIVVITYFRQSTVGVFQKNWGIEASAYAYFSTSVPLLGYWIDKASNSNWITYGMTFFRVPASLTHLLFLNRIGIGNSELLTNTINYINATDEFIQVFPLHSYNNFASMFYYFYLDAREFGVFIGSLFFGLFCKYVSVRQKKEQSEITILMYMLAITGIIKCLAYWPFSTANYFMAIIFALLLRIRGNAKRIHDSQ